MRGWREREESGSECDEERKGERDRKPNGRERETDCGGGGEERASGQGMLVGSLMRLAMHAPYGSDQISDRLPSPLRSLPPSSFSLEGNGKVDRCGSAVSVMLERSRATELVLDVWSRR